MTPKPLIPQLLPKPKPALPAAPISSNTLALPSSRVTLEQFLKVYFESLQKTTTLTAYTKDLMDFAVFIGTASSPPGESPNKAPLLPKYTPELAALTAKRLLRGDQDGKDWGSGEANLIVQEYKTVLNKRGAAPATINRRLSTLRSLVKAARHYGIVNWALTVPNAQNETYRDTTGPGKSNVMRMLAFLAEKMRKSKGISQKQACRDYAIVRLLFDLALRRAEVGGLNLNDYNVQLGKLSILGKGRSQRQVLSLPKTTQQALNMWIAARGVAPGPLFFTLSGKGTGVFRLSETSIYRIVEGLGRKVGVKARPHGLRHAAITEALDKTKGDIRKVMAFSRHKKPETVMLYDDNRKDFGGEVAGMVTE
jgi:integrase/recombinase XerC